MTDPTTPTGKRWLADEPLEERSWWLKRILAIEREAAEPYRSRMDGFMQEADRHKADADRLAGALRMALKYLQPLEHYIDQRGREAIRQHDADALLDRKNPE